LEKSLKNFFNFSIENPLIPMVEGYFYFGNIPLTNRLQPWGISILGVLGRNEVEVMK